MTNDVCTLFALRLGYQVQVIADAGGSSTKDSDDISLRRMQNAGAVITSTSSALTELAHDWSTENGKKVMRVIGELVQQG